MADQETGRRSKAYSLAGDQCLARVQVLSTRVVAQCDDTMQHTEDVTSVTSGSLAFIISVGEKQFRIFLSFNALFFFRICSYLLKFICLSLIQKCNILGKASLVNFMSA